MIRHRYISAIIYFVISSSIIYPTHLASSQQNAQFNINAQKFTDVDSHSRQDLKPQYVIVQEIDSDSSEKINKQWSKLGIVVTSILFFLMIFILFKEEKNTSTKVDQTSNILEKSDANEAQAIPNSSTLAVKTEESTKSTEKASFVMIGMDSEEELNNEVLLNEELIATKQIESSKPEISISDNNVDVIVDSDIMGQLTITTSDTTETKIDVVLELIQDLHQSNQLKDTNTSNDLRRKAIWELGQSNDFRAVEPLIQTMPEVDSLEKGLILDAINQIASRSFDSINHARLTSLKDDNTEVRKNAIQDLTSLYQSMSFVTIQLSKMVNNSNLEVQQTAKWALEKFNQMSDAATSRDSSINFSSNLVSDNSNGSNGKSNYSI